MAEKLRSCVSSRKKLRVTNRLGKCFWRKFLNVNALTEIFVNHQILVSKKFITYKLSSFITTKIVSEIWKSEFFFD